MSLLNNVITGVAVIQSYKANSNSRKNQKILEGIRLRKLEESQKQEELQQVRNNFFDWANDFRYRESEYLNDPISAIHNGLRFEFFLWETNCTNRIFDTMEEKAFFEGTMDLFYSIKAKAENQLSTQEIEQAKVKILETKVDPLMEKIGAFSCAKELADKATAIVFNKIKPLTFFGIFCFLIPLILIFTDASVLADIIFITALIILLTRLCMIHFKMKPGINAVGGSISTTVTANELQEIVDTLAHQIESYINISGVDYLALKEFPDSSEDTIRDQKGKERLTS